jgi:hypothetical protein
MAATEESRRHLFATMKAVIMPASWADFSVREIGICFQRIADKGKRLPAQT